MRKQDVNREGLDPKKHKFTRSIKTCTVCKQKINVEDVSYEMDSGPFDHIIDRIEEHIYGAPFVCDRCLERQEQEQKKRRKNELLTKKWVSTVPENYRATNEDHVEFKKREHHLDDSEEWLKSCLASEQEKLFLGFIGPSGTCKTRMISRLVRILILQGKNVVWLNSGSFIKAIRNKYLDDSIDNLELIRLATECHWLVFDDIGGIKSTDGCLDALYDLLESRSSNRKFTMWTSNERPEDMLQGAREIERNRIISRLAGNSKQIFFKK